MIWPPEETVHPWLAHLQGLTAILKARSKKDGRGPPGVAFFIALDTANDRSTWPIDSGTPVDGWFLDNDNQSERLLFGELVTQDLLNPPPIHRDRPINASLDDLILRAQTVLQAAPLLFESLHSGRTEEVKQLLTAACSLLSSFKAWPSSIPKTWQPKAVNHRIDSSELFRLDIFPGRIDMYSDCQYLEFPNLSTH